ncbi:MAG: hypothetical protein OMM_13859, partial [Candidatus Magnetoglobus multicellularis str. Araruama]
MLVDAVPEFKTLDRELTNELKTRYNPGEQVVIYEDRTPVVFVADKIDSISFACTDSGKRKRLSLVCLFLLVIPDARFSWMNIQVEYIPLL